ncbi:Uncharacterised protein [Leminorella richardii]|uniref:Uncharacterized protein n=2 Tax=Leminorella richardii TaxID=158841 RepID=A0A2X4URF0_9GAMM|nr:Uncharacterised protein [Leminorella richardii]
MRKPRLRLYHLILLLMALSVVVLLILRFSSLHIHADIYHSEVSSDPEELWDPLYSALEFGMQYFLIALIPVGTLISALMFFLFREDTQSY